MIIHADVARKIQPTPGGCVILKGVGISKRGCVSFSCRSQVVDVQSLIYGSGVCCGSKHFFQILVTLRRKKNNFFLLKFQLDQQFFSNFGDSKTEKK